VRRRRSYSRRSSPRHRHRRYGLQVGDVIGSAFSIWFANFLPFSALALLLYSPILVIGYVFWQGMPTEDEVRRFEGIVQLADFVFFSNLLAGTVTFGVVMQLRGKRAEMGRCLTVGLSRLFHVLGVSLLVGLVCAVWFLPGFVMLFASPGLGALLIFVALIPLLVFLTMLYVAVPTVVVERVGIGQALSRSAELTKGYRLTIFGILFLFGLLMMLLAIPVAIVVGFALADVSPTTQFLANSFVEILLSPLVAILPAVIYQSLRVGKEGVDVEDLAAVFE